MRNINYSLLTDEQLVELLFMGEDRLELAWSQEMIHRFSLLPYLSQLVMDKTNWLAELPEWWAVVHATYILGYHGGEETISPLLTALRWADAFDCDWVTEVLPSIFGCVGTIMVPGLSTIARDPSAGWSARDIALKGLAAITLRSPEYSKQIFQTIGELLMDDKEDRIIRQLAGQVLLDFRPPQYRIALLRFSREDWKFRDNIDIDNWYPTSFDINDVEIAFRQGNADTWYYKEDWMRFYQPAEIQRRQKRWIRERLGTSKTGRDRVPPPGGARVLTLSRSVKPAETTNQKPILPPSTPNVDPDSKE